VWMYHGSEAVSGVMAGSAASRQGTTSSTVPHTAMLCYTSGCSTVDCILILSLSLKFVAVSSNCILILSSRLLLSLQSLFLTMENALLCSVSSI